MTIGASAAAAVTTAATVHPPEFAALTPRHAPGFDHIIVVMFENRSFDNVLGHLYSAQEKPADDFDGLAQGAYANPGPDGTPIPAHIYGGSTDAIMQQPQPDSGETYPHVNTQLFSVIDPPSNAHLEDGPIQAPFNPPAEEQAPTNAGFVEDYIVNYRISKRKEPTAKEYSVAMGGFIPRHASGPVDPRARVRCLRPLVRRGALADILQPLLGRSTTTPPSSCR